MPLPGIYQLLVGDNELVENPFAVVTFGLGAPQRESHGGGGAGKWHAAAAAVSAVSAAWEVKAPRRRRAAGGVRTLLGACARQCDCPFFQRSHTCL